MLENTNILYLAGTLVFLPLLMSSLFEWVIKPFFNNRPKRKKASLIHKLNEYDKLNNKNDVQVLSSMILSIVSVLSFLFGSFFLMIMVLIGDLKNNILQNGDKNIFNIGEFIITQSNMLAIIAVISLTAMHYRLIQSVNRMRFIMNFIDHKENFRNEIKSQLTSI